MGGLCLRGHVTTPREALNLLLEFPAWAVVPENLHRLIRAAQPFSGFFRTVTGADLKNSIEDLAIRVTCDQDNVEVRINLLWLFDTLRVHRPWYRASTFGSLLGGQNFHKTLGKGIKFVAGR